MKAPDKIYLNIIDGGSGYMVVPSIEDNGGEQYIRKDALISLIESRISEILGDAQPNPILRMELQGIIDMIKEK